MKDFFILLFGSIILTAVLIFGGIFVGSVLSSDSGKSPEVAASETATIPSAEAENDPVIFGDASTSDGITIPGFSSVVFSAGNAEQNLKLYNPEQNSCYFIISLLLPDGTEIYKSGMIKPGETIEKITLSEPIKAGSYDGSIVRYDCYDSGTLKQLNGANTKFNLEVK